MCEALFLIKDTADLASLSALDEFAGYRIGCAIVIKEDGFQWGTGELTKPCFMIVKLPGIPASDLEYWLSEEEGFADRHLHGKAMRWRQNILDPPKVAAFLGAAMPGENDTVRSVESITKTHQQLNFVRKIVQGGPV